MQRIWIFCSKILPCLTSTTALSHCKKWWFQGRQWPLLILLACVFSLSFFPWKIPPGWVTRGFGATSWSPTQVDLASSSLRRVVGDLCVTWLRGEAFWWDGRNAGKSSLKGSLWNGCILLFCKLQEVMIMWWMEMIPLILLRRHHLNPEILQIHHWWEILPENPCQWDRGFSRDLEHLCLTYKNPTVTPGKGEQKQIQQLFVKFWAKFSFEAVGMDVISSIPEISTIF